MSKHQLSRLRHLSLRATSGRESIARSLVVLFLIGTAFEQHHVGDSVTLMIVRDATRKDVQVRLGST
ncbi:MAG TPA: hypothetical protein VG055_31565 [Planctomycetaceae bacterium]|nr:hypothetical protein [Planctomycetaceae bacterium]